MKTALEPYSETDVRNLLNIAIRIYDLAESGDIPLLATWEEFGQLYAAIDALAGAPAAIAKTKGVTL